MRIAENRRGIRFGLYGKLVFNLRLRFFDMVMRLVRLYPHYAVNVVVQFTHVDKQEQWDHC